MQLILPAELGQLRTFWLTTSRKNPSILILAIGCCWHSCSETYQCSWRLYFHKNLSFGIPSSNPILRAHISPCSYMHSMVWPQDKFPSHQSHFPVQSEASNKTVFCSCILMAFDFPSIYNKLKSSHPKLWTNPTLTKNECETCLARGLTSSGRRW